MAENQKDLDAAEIRRLLGLLDVELTRRGQRATVYVVGGANIALAVDNSRSTTDIDVVVKHGFDVLFDAAKAVAATEPGLGEDWINAAFTDDQPDGGITWQWFDHKDSDTPTPLFTGKGLAVELASPEMVLALKTLAQRPQDMPDIYKLMRLTNITTPEGIGRNLARFTGRRIFDAQGQPGMFLRIDPHFRQIFDGAPEDLRLPSPPPKPQWRHRLRSWVRADQRDKSDVGPRKPRCGMVQVTTRGGVEIRRTQPCSKPAGHPGRHRFGGIQ